MDNGAGVAFGAFFTAGAAPRQDHRDKARTTHGVIG